MHERRTVLSAIFTVGAVCSGLGCERKRTPLPTVASTTPVDPEFNDCTG